MFKRENNAKSSIKNSVMPRIMVDIEMSYKFKRKFKLLYHGMIYLEMQVKNQLTLLNSF